MLAVSPLRSSTPGERDGDAVSKFLTTDDFSAEFDFDFTELFAGFGDAVDVLRGLEMDTSDQILTDFPAGSEESFPDEIAAMEMEMMAVEAADRQHDEVAQPVPSVAATGTEDRVSSEEEVFSASMQEEASTEASASEVNSSPPVVEKCRKPSPAHAKSSQSQGKRRVKVDWTPELHRKFVEVVEQLGVEKAVPSRILELMGIDCLTRHNVASHLQKYRSHRKHMLAREAEAATWSQRRPQMYTAAVPATASSAAGAKREMNPWMQTPTMGFPPPAHHHPHMQTLRPLHVWGHPTVDQSLVHMWPKHLFPARPAAVPSPPWMAPYPAPLQGPPPPPPPLPHVSPWHPHFARGALTQGTPYFPRPLPTMRFSAPPVPGIPPHPMYRHDGTVPSASSPPPPLPGKPSDWPVQLDSHPSKESIDAAIGDVLAQPWLPLPLGLKPPSLESVMVELQKQGVSNIPPCN